MAAETITESIRITYLDQQRQPHRFDLERPSQGKKHATHADGAAIANEAFRLLSGTDAGSHFLGSNKDMYAQWVHQYTTGGTAVDPLSEWDRRAKANYEGRVTRLTRSLRPTSLAAVQDAARLQNRYDKEEGRAQLSGKGVFGKAWALLNRYEVGGWRAEFLAKHFIAGRDCENIEQFLSPGKTMNDLVYGIRTIFRRQSDNIMDAGDAVGGPLRSLAAQIKRMQKGPMGGIIQSYLKKSKPAQAIVETVLTSEKLLSTDPLNTKLNFPGYEALFDSVAEGKQGSPIFVHLPQPAVVEDRSDGVNERQQFAAFGYMKRVLSANPEKLNLEQRRHQRDLSEALLIAMRSPRTEGEIFIRGQVSTIEDRLVGEIEKRAPGVMTAIKDLVHPNEAKLPESYKAELAELKEIEINQPNETFIQKVIAIEEKIKSGEIVLPPEVTVLWKHAGEYAQAYAKLISRAEVLYQMPMPARRTSSEVTAAVAPQA